MKTTRTLLLVGATLLATVGVHPAESAATTPAINRLVIHADQGNTAINRNIYGHFSEHLGRCIYEGYWVGESSPIANVRGIRQDVVQALRRLKTPVLRWPGGCFADEYHWKDGIGPREKRPALINTHWGGVVESNHFGTHEFMDLCEQIGCDAYISGNVGSGSVQEMMEWVEYLTSDADSPIANLRRQNGREKPWKVRYFGVGNESWGCGGNMTPEYYADQFRRYNTFVKNYGDSRIYRIACGASDFNYDWTEVLMARVGRRMDGLSVHYYTLPSGNWDRKGSATDFSEDVYHATLRRALEIETVVTRHGAIMDRQDPQKRIGMIVDEWGVWTDVEPGTNPGFLYQQNSLRDALVAGLTFNIFNRHADRVKMANIAQTVNVLQAMILTDKEKMVLTPTYHVFEMFAVHHDATLLPTELQSADYAVGQDKIPAVNASASKDSSGKIHVTFCNLNPNAVADVECALSGMKPGAITGRVLTAPTFQAHNTFADPQAVTPAAFGGFKAQEGGFTVALPAKSIVTLEIEGAK